jgi:hypothetical protein
LKSGEGEVVHGTGVKAAKDFKKGETLLDASAGFRKGHPPDFTPEHYFKDDGDSYRNILIGGKRGYFQIRSYASDDEKKDKGPHLTSTTFYINEARGGTKPNIKWTAIENEKGQPPVLGWRIIKEIKKDDELLAKYTS